MLTITRLGLCGLLLTLTPLAYAEDSPSEEMPDIFGEEEGEEEAPEEAAEETPESSLADENNVEDRTIAVGMSEVIDLPYVVDKVIRTSEDVEITATTDQQLVVQGQRAGQTHILVYDSQGTLRDNIGIVVIQGDEPAEEAQEEAEEAGVLEEPTPPTPAIVTLTDGQVLRGNAWDNGSGGLMLELPGGAVMDLSADAVESVRYLDQTSGDGSFAYPNPAASRYFFAPTAIPLEQGSLYLAQKMIIFTEVAYTPTENITIMGASSIPMFFAALTEGEFDILGGLFGAKVSAPAGDGFWAGGGVWGAVFDGEVFALPFGNVTFGTPDKNLTLGAGYGFMADAVADSVITVVIAGSTRLNDKIALVTENWVFAVPDNLDDPLIALSGGVRFISRQLTADLALMSLAMPGEFIFIPIPWLDLAWRFR